MAAVRNGELSIRSAARRFGFSFSCLQRQMSENYVPKGRCTVLTATEEERIVQWIMDISKQGFPVSATELKDSVQMFLNRNGRNTKFKDNRPGRDWFSRFMQRHHVLSIRLAENLNKARAAVTEVMIRAWFTEVSVKMRELYDI